MAEVYYIDSGFFKKYFRNYQNICSYLMISVDHKLFLLSERSGVCPYGFMNLKACK